MLVIHKKKGLSQVMAYFSDINSAVSSSKSLKMTLILTTQQ